MASALLRVLQAWRLLAAIVITFGLMGYIMACSNPTSTPASSPLVCDDSSKIVVSDTRYSYGTSVLVNVIGTIKNTCNRWAKVWPEALVADRDGEVMNAKAWSSESGVSLGYLWLSPGASSEVEVKNVLVSDLDDIGGVRIQVRFEFSEPPYGYGSG